MTSQILTIRRILEGVRTKNQETTILFVDFSRAFDSIQHREDTITDTDNADDIAFLANTPAQPETLLYSLERAATSKGLHVNADKMKYICFNQRGDISTLNGSSLKLVVKFTFLGRNISSTKTDINTLLAKPWTAIDRLSVIRKSDLTDKIKFTCFQTVVVSIVLHGCTTGKLTKRMKKKLTAITQECCEKY